MAGPPADPVWRSSIEQDGARAGSSGRDRRDLRSLGASGLIYEVVWSWQLVLVFGNTTQAIAAG